MTARSHPAQTPASEEQASRAATRCTAAVIADTHLRSGGGAGRPPRRGLPAAALDILRSADVILHAGDVLDAGIIEELSSMAPTLAVLGNNDMDLVGVLPPTRVVDLAGVRVGMIHDAGTREGRPGRMARRFPGAAVVVFGHSHVPCDEEGIGGQRLFNPGSPTQRRAQPRHTMGVLELGGGEVLAHRIVDLD